MNVYIKRGRFGEFVTKIFEAKQKEEQEKQERDEEWQLWIMYTRLYPTIIQSTFMEWKNGLKQQTEKQEGGNRGGCSDADLTEEGIQNIINSVFSE